jgi:hypothetical protein
MMTRRTAEQRKPLLASSVISGYISGMPKQRPLPPSKSRPSSSAALAEHRKRLRSRGLQRLEVQVRGEDAPLLRAIAAALADPGQAAEARASLLRQFAPAPCDSLKALIASAPLNGIDLDRPRDMGRAIDL